MSIPAYPSSRTVRYKCKVTADAPVFDLDGQGVAAHASRFEEDGFLCLDDVADDSQQVTNGGVASACA